MKLDKRTLGVDDHIIDIVVVVVDLVVGLAPGLRDHVDGLGVEQRLRVRDAGQRGGGWVTDAESGGVAGVVVRVQGARV